MAADSRTYSATMVEYIARSVFARLIKVSSEVGHQTYPPQWYRVYLLKYSFPIFLM